MHSYSYNKLGGRDRAAVIAIRYEMDSPGIETRWGARYSAPVQTGTDVL